MYYIPLMNKTPSWFQYPNYNWKTKHATIIGGGIAGAQMAWHLCQADWQVTLIERHTQLATEASGNPIGVISPKMTALPSNGEDFYTQSFHYTLALLKTLEASGKRIEWDACGALQLAHNPHELKRWQALKDRGLSPDFIQLLDEAETKKIAGIHLNADQPYKSSYFPQGSWINPISFSEALSQHPNCKIILATEVLQLEKADGYWRLLSHSGESIAESEVVIITNGRDLFNFEQSTFLPHMPVVGQTTFAPASAFSSKLKTVIGHEGYLTPAIHSQHVFGATFDRNENNPMIKAESDTENFKQLQQYLPEFTNSLANIKSAHAAVRITTPDRFPYVGGLPDKDFYQREYQDLHQGRKWKSYPSAEYQKGLFMLGGLGSRGLTTSGYCAKILTLLLENKLENTLDSNEEMKHSKTLLQNCHPARFLIKALKRRQ